MKTDIKALKKFAQIFQIFLYLLSFLSVVIAFKIRINDPTYPPEGRHPIYPLGWLLLAVAAGIGIFVNANTKNHKWFGRFLIVLGLIASVLVVTGLMSAANEDIIIFDEFTAYYPGGKERLFFALSAIAYSAATLMGVVIKLIINRRINSRNLVNNVH